MNFLRFTKEIMIAKSFIFCIVLFFPGTSANVGTSPQNILNFSFNPFVTLMGNLKFVLSASPKLLNLNQDQPSKKGGLSGQILIKLRLW